MKHLRLLLPLLVLFVALEGAPVAATASGSLPPTNAEPSFGAPLTKQMRQLVAAIAANSNSLGVNVFFSRAAYLQMKTGAIPYPSNDYTNRLLYFFELDLRAYHSALFTHATTTLLRVEANPRDASWIPAGACENKIGYWHVSGVRLELRRNNAVVSVAVDSLISWRGVWYVVHLGPNPRSVNTGVVDGFEAGPGTPGPPGGC